MEQFMELCWIRNVLSAKQATAPPLLIHWPALNAV